ncbi:diguanylate cyclase [Gluconobacter cerinus]|uniref:diguanylate cyclase n=1 Tax=Gluconobacter cerinus TaxID=38307 RepID=UPI001B8BD6C9|nr:diguanylate cyclase [Gluconobacter cerinus]MBS1040415.1 diguanylate cyclase [Gluconobacter cerinus]MBS1046618.1 diguanylate cyclase [Gluconobacter cerinus]
MTTDAREVQESSAALKEWQNLIAQTSDRIRNIVAEVIDRHAMDCVQRFYDVLLNNADAAPFLSNEIVDTRLRAALGRWLAELFSHDAPDADALVQTQKRIGGAHARIQIPIHVVMHGARLLKRKLRMFIQGLELVGTEYSMAIAYVEDMIDIAIEVMSLAFVQGTRKEVEVNEAFRLMALGKDVSLERETQRAALLEWGQSFLLDICYGGDSASTLSDSAFGLWLRHKGSVLFQGASEIDVVLKAVEHVDNDFVPKFVSERPMSPQAVKALQGALNEIHYMMDQLFKAAEAVENGRDPLTKTLSRRFLPTILGREVSLSLRRHIPFSVLMVDVDHFKSINDTFGHVVGDSVLRYVAKVLVTQCRMSDFIFRYGGEEFLVLLTETAEEQAIQVAERIREAIERECVLVVNGNNIHTTASFGIATFDGHPDYRHLIEDADRALYLAKSSGRNQYQVSKRCGPVSQTGGEIEERLVDGSSV